MQRMAPARVAVLDRIVRAVRHLAAPVASWLACPSFMARAPITFGDEWPKHCPNVGAGALRVTVIR
jgi:hypothetical protein